MTEDMNLLGVEEHVMQDRWMWRAALLIQLHPRWENADDDDGDYFSLSGSVGLTLQTLKL